MTESQNRDLCLLYHPSNPFLFHGFFQQSLFSLLKKFNFLLNQVRAHSRPWARLVYCNCFRKSVCVCVPIYLSMFVRTHPREQNHLITVKAAFT